LHGFAVCEHVTWMGGLSGILAKYTIHDTLLSVK